MDPNQTTPAGQSPLGGASTAAPVTPQTPPKKNPIADLLFKIQFMARVGQLRALKVLFLVFFLIFVLVGGAMAATVYTDIKLPILSEQKNNLTLLFYKIPLIPKNPEQILIAAVDKNTRLKTYTPDFSFTAQLNTTDVELGSVDLQIDGPVDITDEKNIAFSVNATAAVNFGGKSYQLDGKLISKDKAIYGKIDKLPEELVQMYSGLTGNSYITAQPTTPQEEIRANLEQLFTNWIKYEFKSLPTKAREELEKNIENTSITNSIREEAQNFLLKSSILPEVKKLADEKIEGVDTYHLILKPSREKTKQIIIEYVEQYKEAMPKDPDDQKEYKKTIEAIAGSFEQLHLEMWVGKNDAIVRKTSLQTQMDLGFLQSLYGGGSYSSTTAPNYFGLGDLGKAKLASSTVVVLKDVNKPVTITLPTKTVTVEEYMKLFQESFMTKAQKAQQEQKAQQTKDLTAIGQALTKYYVETGAYPVTLSAIAPKYLTDTTIASKLNSYSYRRNSTGSNYAVYILSSSSTYSSYDSPYFGITHSYIYPHQLSATEFTEVNQ